MENKSNQNKKETTFSALDFLITIESKNNESTSSVQDTLITTQSGLKKLIINNTNDSFLDQLTNLGVSSEILNEVTSSNFDDIKNKQSELAEKIWKEKENQKSSSELSDVKFNPITGTFDEVIPGIKFNPLTGGFDIPENLLKDLKNGVINDAIEEKTNHDIQKISTTSSSELSTATGIKFNPLTGGFDFSDSLLKDLKNGVINDDVEEKANHEIQKTLVSDQYQSVVKKADENNNSKQKIDITNNLNMGSLGNLVLELLKNEPPNEFIEKEIPPLANNTKETSNDFSIPVVEKNKPLLDKPIFNPEKPLPINTSKGAPVFSKVNEPELPKLMPNMPNMININETNKNINVSTTIEYSDREKNELKSIFKINEDTGVFLDITLNTTKKEDAINILNQYCKSKYSTTTIDNVLFYDDKGINLYFENNIVKELEFKGNFDGYTSKGLKLGDTIEQAINLYGKPTIMTNKGAVWRNIKIFIDKNTINSIKIQK